MAGLPLRFMKSWIMPFPYLKVLFPLIGFCRVIRHQFPPDSAPTRGRRIIGRRSVNTPDS